MKTTAKSAKSTGAGDRLRQQRAGKRSSSADSTTTAAEAEAAPSRPAGLRGTEPLLLLRQRRPPTNKNTTATSAGSSKKYRICDGTAASSPSSSAGDADDGSSFRGGTSTSTSTTSKARRLPFSPVQPLLLRADVGGDNDKSNYFVVAAATPFPPQEQQQSSGSKNRRGQQYRHRLLLHSSAAFADGDDDYGTTSPSSDCGDVVDDEEDRENYYYYDNSVASKKEATVSAGGGRTRLDDHDGCDFDDFRGGAADGGADTSGTGSSGGGNDGVAVEYSVDDEKNGAAAVVDVVRHNSNNVEKRAAGASEKCGGDGVATLLTTTSTASTSKAGCSTTESASRVTTASSSSSSSSRGGGGGVAVEKWKGGRLVSVVTGEMVVAAASARRRRDKAAAVATLLPQQPQTTTTTTTSTESAATLEQVAEVLTFMMTTTTTPSSSSSKGATNNYSTSGTSPPVFTPEGLIDDDESTPGTTTTTPESINPMATAATPTASNRESDIRASVMSALLMLPKNRRRRQPSNNDDERETNVQEEDDDDDDLICKDLDLSLLLLAAQQRDEEDSPGTVSARAKGGGGIASAAAGDVAALEVQQQPPPNSSTAVVVAARTRTLRSASSSVPRWTGTRNAALGGRRCNSNPSLELSDGGSGESSDIVGTGDVAFKFGNGLRLQWTEDEQQAFHNAFVEHGKNYKKIAESLPRRTQKACAGYYDRYYRHNKKPPYSNNYAVPAAAAEAKTTQDTTEDDGRSSENDREILDSANALTDGESWHGEEISLNHAKGDDSTTKDDSDDDDDGVQGFLERNRGSEKSGVKSVKTGKSFSRDPWSSEEQRAFHRAFQTYGANAWNKIARSIPGRTPGAVQSFYRRYYQHGLSAPMNSRSASAVAAQQTKKQQKRHGSDLVGRAKKQKTLPASQSNIVIWDDGLPVVRSRKSVLRYDPSDEVARGDASSSPSSRTPQPGARNNDLVASSVKKTKGSAIEKKNMVDGDDDDDDGFRSLTRSCWSEKEQLAFHKAFVKCGSEKWVQIAKTMGSTRTIKALTHYYRRYYAPWQESRNKRKRPTADSTSDEEGKEEEEEEDSDESDDDDEEEEASATSSDNGTGGYNGKWTEKDILAFQKAFEKHSTNWKAVAAMVPGRTVSGVFNFYRRYISLGKLPDYAKNMGITISSNSKKKRKTGHNAPASATGTDKRPRRANTTKTSKSAATKVSSSQRGGYRAPWSADEAETFHSAFVKYGRDFQKIAEHLPGRSAKGVECHWYEKYRHKGQSTEKKSRKKSSVMSSIDSDDGTSSPTSVEDLAVFEQPRVDADRPVKKLCFEEVFTGTPVVHTSSSDFDRLLTHRLLGAPGCHPRVDDKILGIFERIGLFDRDGSPSFGGEYWGSMQDIARMLVRDGVPFGDSLSPGDLSELESWACLASAVDEDDEEGLLLLSRLTEHHRSGDNRPSPVSISNNEIVRMLTRTDCYRGEPVVLHHSGEMHFLLPPTKIAKDSKAGSKKDSDTSNGSIDASPTPRSSEAVVTGVVPDCSLGELRTLFRSRRDEFRVKLDRVADPNKRLALQLWIASSPDPLPRSNVTSSLVDVLVDLSSSSSF